MKIRILLKVAIQVRNLMFHVNPNAVLCNLIFNLIIYVDLKKLTNMMDVTFDQ